MSKELKNMDPWDTSNPKTIICAHCNQPIDGSDIYIWVPEREKSGKRTGKLLYYHNNLHKKCYLPGREIRKEEIKEQVKMIDGKLIPEDFDEW